MTDERLTELSDPMFWGEDFDQGQELIAEVRRLNELGEIRWRERNEARQVSRNLANRLEMYSGPDLVDGFRNRYPWLDASFSAPGSSD